MITISPGHHTASPGAQIDGHSEHAEACLWVGAIAALVPGAKVVTGTSTQKAQASSGAALAVELHFGANKFDSTSGTTVLSVKDGDAVGHATSARIAAVLSEYVPLVRRGNGLYRDGNGLDFFLAKAQCPAVLICIDDFNNLAWLQGIRESACRQIASALTVQLEIRDG